MLQHDMAKPEDVDTESDDHCADAVRYGAMSRPYVAHVDKPPEEKILAVGTGTTATLDDIVQAQKQPRLRERI